MRNAPKQQEDTPGTKQGIHRVYHPCHLGRGTGKLREQVTHEHKERSTRWMPNLQEIGR